MLMGVVANWTSEPLLPVLPSGVAAFTPGAAFELLPSPTLRVAVNADAATALGAVYADEFDRLLSLQRFGPIFDAEELWTSTSVVAPRFVRSGVCEASLDELHLGASLLGARMVPLDSSGTASFSGLRVVA